MIATLPRAFAPLWRRLGVPRLATQLIALWKLVRHPATPRPAKWAALAVLAYAISPIDLVPDFIPVLGQLDDLLLIPLGVALVVRLVPREHWRARLAEAEEARGRMPRLLWGAAAVGLGWLGMLAGFVAWLWRLVRG